MIQKTLDDFGGVDIFISNAAANPHFGPLLSCSEDAWDKIFETNVKATFMLCKEIVPLMEKEGEVLLLLLVLLLVTNPLNHWCLFSQQDESFRSN